MANFGQEIRRLMLVKGLTQQQLADAAGVRQSFVSKLVRGEQKSLGADMLFKLAAALGVGCDHFRPHFAEVHVVEPVKPAAKRKGKK